MLPILIRLQNFLSYGADDSQLDFRGISLACLTGDNGVGKSSLLEAITWAVWGSARVSSDDELIRTGATDMEVQFIFSAQNATYRIIRKRAKRKKMGVSTLEFQILDAPASEVNTADMKSEHWRSLTEPTIRATQAKIISVVGMSYETFVNSAFLRQGHADEFTVKRPNERKTILADILGLHLYDALVERAREKARVSELSIQSISLFLERAKESVIDRTKLERDVQEQSVLRDEAARLLAGKEQTVRDLRASLAKSQVSAAKLEGVSVQIRELESEITLLQKTGRELASQVAEFRATQQHKDSITAQFAEYQGVFERFQRMQEKNAKRILLLQKREKAQATLDQLRDAIQREMDGIDGQKSVLKSATKKASDAKLELRTLHAELEDHVQLQKSIDQILERMAKLKGEHRSLEDRIVHIEKEAGEVKERQGDLKKAKAACPLCKQKLSASHLKEVLREFDEKLTLLRTEYAENRATTKRLTEEINTLEESLIELKKSLVQFEKLKEREGTLKNIIDEQERARSTLAVLAARIEELKKQLDADPAIIAARTAVETIDREVTLLAVDGAEYAACEAAVKKLEPVVAAKHNLDLAELKLVTAEKQRTDSEATLKERQRKLTELHAAYETHEPIARTFAAISKDVTLMEEELVSLQQSLRDSDAQLVRLKDALERAAIEEKQIATQQAELQRHTTERAIYDQLAEVFGKRGIQAMIIDAAIPEIEQEANIILSRMTGNQMHITFELQKDKKTGDGVIETLDIKISDEIGTRTYELFSGGEAFRINFAIRVALSRLLARRAGAKLRMLIIDEGFGTLDVSGRDHLVAAIRAIRNEFDKIIVITHIPELKDAFAEKIQIVKTSRGSEIQMVA